ncbi:hypothetical protein PIB30_003121 [Stylosanthes scabra]|uniref:Uncharacterized protein n=1 Tax=Stylosanthes scabra TaxID=79078 RepID=A0ABU6Y016_9FABA|nr:hypothetical protein [Stylosanthes scabra]
MKVEVQACEEVGDNKQELEVEEACKELGFDKQESKEAKTTLTHPLRTSLANLPSNTSFEWVSLPCVNFLGPHQYALLETDGQLRALCRLKSDEELMVGWQHESRLKNEIISRLEVQGRHPPSPPFIAASLRAVTPTAEPSRSAPPFFFHFFSLVRVLSPSRLSHCRDLFITACDVHPVAVFFNRRLNHYQPLLNLFVGLSFTQALQPIMAQLWPATVSPCASVAVPLTTQQLLLPHLPSSSLGMRCFLGRRRLSRQSILRSSSKP